MEKNYIAPAVDKTAFHCPHCGTKAPQKWLNCYANSVSDNIPFVWSLAEYDRIFEGLRNRSEKEKPSTEVIQNGRQKQKQRFQEIFVFRN